MSCRRHNATPSSGGLPVQPVFSGWCPRVSRPDFLFEVRCLCLLPAWPLVSGFGCPAHMFQVPACPAARPCLLRRPDRGSACTACAACPTCAVQVHGERGHLGAQRPLGTCLAAGFPYACMPICPAGEPDAAAQGHQSPALAHFRDPFHRSVTHPFVNTTVNFCLSCQSCSLSVL